MALRGGPACLRGLGCLMAEGITGRPRLRGTARAVAQGALSAKVLLMAAECASLAASGCTGEVQAVRAASLLGAHKCADCSRQDNGEAEVHPG